MPEPVIVPDAPNPELLAAREELNILHTLFGIVKNGTIKAIDWPQAKSTLDYLDSKIQSVQKHADSLAPTEASH